MYYSNTRITYTPKQGRGYNPRQQWWGSCSLTNCKHIFGFYYKQYPSLHEAAELLNMDIRTLQKYTL